MLTFAKQTHYSTYDKDNSSHNFDLWTGCLETMLSNIKYIARIMSSAVLVKTTWSSQSAIVTNMSGTWGAQTSAMKHIRWKSKYGFSFLY